MDETRLHGSLAINENQFFHQVSLRQNVDMRAQMIRLSELRSEVCVEDNMRTCVQLREVHVPSIGPDSPSLQSTFALQPPPFPLVNHPASCSLLADHDKPFVERCRTFPLTRGTLGPSWTITRDPLAPCCGLNPTPPRERVGRREVSIQGPPALSGSHNKLEM